MSIVKTARRVIEAARIARWDPHLLSLRWQRRRGLRYAEHWTSRPVPEAMTSDAPADPLLAYFESHLTGRGIWKWRHYFEVYERHFRKFVGQEVHLVEVGIYSGGSLDMWRSYFGPQCRVYGVDIEPDCKAYEDADTRIFIGDQADREFWRSFREQVPRVDILIDDGGHLAEQQIITLEEMLPQLSSGGVYLCEDVTTEHNLFSAYLAGFVDAMNAGGSQVGKPNAIQRDIQSVHSYPFVFVIEKCGQPRTELVAPKRGTEWQPFPFK